jgi:hypothetical protein
MAADLQRASEEASRLFVDIYEKLETRTIDPGIDLKSLVDVFRNTLKNEGAGLLDALKDFREKVRPVPPVEPSHRVEDSRATVCSLPVSAGATGCPVSDESAG